MKRKALGRGLSALLSNASADVVNQRAIEELAVGAIEVNHWQPRTHFSDSALDELAQSIRTHGVLQPLLVRRHPEIAGRYQLIAGERRLRASKQIELDSVPCIIIDAQESDMLEIALIENIQRADLSPVEEAKAYAHLVQRFELTQEEIAVKVGKSREAIANAIRLLQLPETILYAVEIGDISPGHARALLGLSSHKQMEDALLRILDNNWSVRQTEAFVRATDKMSGNANPSSQKKDISEDVHIADLRRNLETVMQTKVEVKMKGKNKGAVIIHFFDFDQLDHLLNKWNVRL